jgi:hypothetical protein
MRGERRGERIVPPECVQPVRFHPVPSVPQPRHGLARSGVTACRPGAFACARQGQGG